MSPFIKKYLPILCLLFVIYAGYFLYHALKHTSPRSVLGANTGISLFEQPDGGRQPILDALNSARSEVLVEVYLLSDKQIIQALEDAESRGVSVKVMLEQHPFGGGNLNTRTETTLRQNNVSVEWTNPGFTLTHEKSIVIDSQEAFILNQNLTAAAFTKNREYDVLDTDPADVAEVKNIFISDWGRKSFTPPDTHLIVSPDTARGALTALIQNATKSIDIEMESIEDKEIESILALKAKTVHVRIIVPTFTQITTNKVTVSQLVQSGAEVETVKSPYIHAKVIVVDDSKAYIGSVNLSSQSMDENRELGIMLSSNDSISTIDDTFSRDWGIGTQVTTSN